MDGRKTCLAAALATALTCSGCGIFSPEFIPLDANDPVVAELLGKSRQEALDELSKIVGHPVVDYTLMGDEVVTKVMAPMEEALNKYNETVLKGIDKASTPWELLLALAAGGAAGGSVLVDRLTGRKQHGGTK